MKLTGTLLFCGYVSAFVAERSQTKAPYQRLDIENLVPEGYIVRLHPNHTLEDHFVNIGFDVRQLATVFLEMSTSNSYLFELSESNHSMIHDFIRHDPGVLKIEHDTFLQNTLAYEIEPEQPAPTFPQSLTKIGKRWSLFVSHQAPWNQVMITYGKMRDFVGEKGYSFNGQATLDGAGAGVNVYVMDSGIRIEHADFQGATRKIASHFGGKKSSEFSPYCTPGNNGLMDDNLGHGTHVASVISNRYGGVAEDANLINVKIVCKGGTLGKLEAAVNDILVEHKNNINNPPKGWKGSVINMSVGYNARDASGGVYEGIQAALANAKTYGIPIAAAAGNKNIQTIDIPAKFTSTYSVGAVGVDYKRWQTPQSGSNYHKNLNIWAPGKAIYSAWIEPDQPSKNDLHKALSGTSMASPHVAGVMAIMMGYEGYGQIQTGQGIYNRLDLNAIPVVIPDISMDRFGGTLNLLQSGIKNGNNGLRHPYAGVEDRFLPGKKPVVHPGPENVHTIDTPMPVQAPGEDNIDGDALTFLDVQDESTPAPAPAPSPTGPRPRYDTTCNQHTDPRISFTREEAIDTFNRGCGTAAFDQKLIKPMKANIYEGSKNLTMLWGWSGDQNRCEKRTDDMFSHKDCTDWFTAAMDNCDTNSRTEKWGSKMIFSGEKGCIDIELSGGVRH